MVSYNDTKVEHNDKIFFLNIREHLQTFALNSSPPTAL